MSDPITVDEMLQRGAQLRNPLAGRLYLLALAHDEHRPSDVRRAALSQALGVTLDELDAAAEELVRVGLATEWFIQ